MEWLGQRVAIAALLLIPTGASAAEQAGVAAGVRGNIELASLGAAAGSVGKLVKSGEQIFIGDRIKSSADGAMQVMLLDETVFTIGPDSDITIDEFVYDPNTGQGKVTANIGKGAFRFITGKVAQAKPENMSVKTPSATIGVRGTIVYGLTTETGSVIALGGPGSGNNGGERVGAAVVTSGGNSVSLQREGFAAIITPGGGITTQRMDESLKNRIFGALAPARPAARLLCLSLPPPQYHPEASPGPHDADVCFELYVDMMKAERAAKVAA